MHGKLPALHIFAVSLQLVLDLTGEDGEAFRPVATLQLVLGTPCHNLFHVDLGEEGWTFHLG